MPRKASPMSALAVSRLKAPGLHFVGTVDGLALQITSTKARSWVLRATIGGKKRDMGLGGFPDVTLAGAHEAARAARVKLKQGTALSTKTKLLEARWLGTSRGNIQAGVRSFIITFDAYVFLNIFENYDNKRPDPICLCDPICL